MPTRPKRYKPAGPARHKRRRPTAADRGPYCTAWWQRTRVRIARRDHWECQQCGQAVGMSKGDYHCHHRIERVVGSPLDQRGCDRDDNLETLCQSCHNQHPGARQHRA